MEELEKQGLAVESEGATAVFLEGVSFATVQAAGTGHVLND